MRSVLCLLVVCLLAPAATAQFSGKEGAALRANEKKAADAAAAKKTANEKAQNNKAGAAQGNESDLTDALLVAMDADHDGVVTKLEYRDALKALAKVHKDKQGAMAVPAQAAANPNAANTPQPQDAGLGQGPGGVGAPGSLADGRTNNEAMGRFLQLDRNRDGRLSADEVTPQDRAMLQGADLNNDGMVDARELQIFARKMGDRMRAFPGAGNNNGNNNNPNFPGNGNGKP